MNAPTVLLISRGTMSGGEAVGGCLAREEGIQYLTREDLLSVVNTYGDLATRVASRIAKAVEAYEEFSQLRRPYQILMKRALLEYAQKGGLAYFGYSGHLLLDRVRHFVRVRLLAPLELRVARARERMGCSEGEARDFIRAQDRERIHWARMMYGVDIRDPGLYDISINIERLSLPCACDLLRSVMRQADFQSTPESVTQVENDYVATGALALLATDPRTMQLELGATFAAGALHLVGPYLSEDEMRTVRTIAEAVPEIHSIDYEPGYAPALQYAR